MYQTKLSKEQPAYNISYHISHNPDRLIEETIKKVLTLYEEKSKKATKTLDKERRACYNEEKVIKRSKN